MSKAMTAEQFWKLNFPKEVDEAGVCEFAEAYVKHVTEALSQENEQLKQELADEYSADKEIQEIIAKNEEDGCRIAEKLEKAEAQVEALGKERDAAKDQAEGLAAAIRWASKAE
jgi:DNA anti-recombination protein RmuC